MSLTEEYIKRNLDYDTFVSSPNRSLMMTLEKRIRDMRDGAVVNRTNRLRADAGGDLPDTVNSYLRIVSTIIRDNLSAQYKTEAMIGRQDTKPYSNRVRLGYLATLFKRENPCLWGSPCR